ncbi:ArdC-like ssDNA-binding domain-containing protein [Cellulomonas sp. C5510]|uniref:ArdC-like ssDNA-binding domain-containing protein n=1 Tax=Cellulomonas sp. C5510 TaxID=2871170 RepID=UPI002107DC7A|nr:ArdC-like ssDNA-binding domain-containing protein [Cellulomonas sp. C5510]
MVVSRQPDVGTREDRLEALHRQLIDAVEKLSTSEGWARMLQAAARFHDYSPSNVLLISAQRPDATRVAGIRTWNSLGRRVKRGQHGIAILAPCVYPAPPGASSEESAVEAGAMPPAEPSGSAGPARHLRGFRVVHVFDVTQTEGEPLAEVPPVQLAGAAPEGLWEHLTSLAGADGYRIERGPCRKGTMGYTDFTARTVRVRDDVDGAQAVKTLAHELGHIRADHEHRFPDYAASRACRGRAEVEAESIAYLITAQAGADSTAYSVPYLAGWSGGASEVLRESMTLVLAVARETFHPASDYRSTIQSDPAQALVSERIEPESVPAVALA